MVLPLASFLASSAGAAGGSSMLGSVGSFLSGASSFLGGLGIGGGGGSSRKRERDSIQIANEEALKQAKLMPSALRAGAEKAGLHPLSVLGINTSSGPSSYVDGRHGIDLEAMGQGIDRAANAGRSSVQRKLDDLALEQAQLSNDYLRVQIAGAQKAITNTAGVPPMDSGISSQSGGNVSGNLNDYLRGYSVNRIGIDDGIVPMHKIMVDERGRGIRYLNTQDIGDNEVLMLVDGIAATFPDMARNMLRQYGGELVSNVRAREKKVLKKARYKPSYADQKYRKMDMSGLFSRYKK